MEIPFFKQNQLKDWLQIVFVICRKPARAIIMSNIWVTVFVLFSLGAISKKTSHWKNSKREETWIGKDCMRHCDRYFTKQLVWHSIVGRITEVIQS